jgi:hypothetical protein
MKLCFQPYIERPKLTPYATWASVLLCTLLDSELGSNLNCFWSPPRGLEPDQPWTSFLTWKTLLDSIFSNPCTTHGHKHDCHVLIILPLLKESRPRRRLYLKMILHNTTENGVAEIKQVKTIVRRNVTMFSIVYHVMSHKIASISGVFVINRHIMFVITILQKISTNKGHNKNSQC